MMILAQVNFGLNVAGLIGIIYLLLAIVYFILMLVWLVPRGTRLAGSALPGFLTSEKKTLGRANFKMI
ncbi:hypothetical protein [aff. Roholtiella sp. LEGE 12411]|uniref:hypothetical protein n=1 Tax=aff. Roholtiella sp. LEGE 12411 TaxID=1828822 RepID=UPI00187E7EED|nr:hypothetical protein [aff. Roholtiella sp. LEGE 12411]MBE9035560.1 hypothetical protein [aff. Roholtiella sp. LEGE 12411]